MIAFSIPMKTKDFMLYKSGVYTGPSCHSPTKVSDLNHAMIAIGYGVDDTGVEYAIIRNSWGMSWGDQGYVHIELKNNNFGLCGLYLRTY